MTSDPDELELREAEREALHELQVGVEHVYRAYGDLLEFHHKLGHAMDRIADGEELLREAGHEAWADTLRDEQLPAGATDDRWTYERWSASSPTASSRRSPSSKPRCERSSQTASIT